MRLSGERVLVALTVVVGATLGSLIGGVGSSSGGDITLAALSGSTTSTVAPDVATTEPPTSSTPVVERTRIYIIGDSYTGGSEMNEDPEWPALMNEIVNDAGIAVDYRTDGVGGSGYTTGGQGEAFPDRVEDVQPSAGLVIVFGSRNDGGRTTVTELRQVAGDMFRAIEEQAPAAELLVIGPPWVNEDVPETLVEVRDGLALAAADVGATFVDPIADGWFFGADSALIGSDGVHPIDEGHAYMAERIAAAVLGVLGGG